MAGNLEMNVAVNLGESEQPSKEVAEEAAVAEESASSSTAIAIAEKHDGVDNEKATDANDKNIIETVNDKTIADGSSTVAGGATSKHGEATNTRTRDKRKPVLNANAASWSPKELEQSKALLSQSWKLSLPSTKKLLILDVNGLLVASSRFPKGLFNETNTLLIDDTPYKALWNPPYTAIFPEAYWYNEADIFLKGTLTEYLKQLRDAADVPEFVRTHPFCETAIVPGCLHWNVYQQVLKRKPQEDILSPLQTIPTMTLSQISSPEVLLEQTRLENLSLV